MPVLTLIFVIALAAVAALIVLAAVPSTFRSLRATVWYARGLWAYRRERYDAARRHWERAVAIAPWYASAHYNLGVLHGKANRTDEAITCYQRAVEVNPGLAKAYFNLGNAYLAREEFRRAAQAYEAATRTRRGHLRSHLNLGILYQQNLLDDRKALYHFTEYLRLGGTDRRVLGNVAHLKKRLG